jgi:hypothetical protein
MEVLIMAVTMAVIILADIAILMDVARCCV